MTAPASRDCRSVLLPSAQQDSLESDSILRPPACAASAHDIPDHSGHDDEADEADADDELPLAFGRNDAADEHVMKRAERPTMV